MNTMSFRHGEGGNYQSNVLNPSSSTTPLQAG
jgi:hypothetical protein